jgi:hypothetical protein
VLFTYICIYIYLDRRQFEIYILTVGQYGGRKKKALWICLSISNQGDQIGRIFGRLFTLVSFYCYIRSPNFWPYFSTVKVMQYIWQKRAVLRLGHFFPKTHLVTLIFIPKMEETYLIRSALESFGFTIGLKIFCVIKRLPNSLKRKRDNCQAIKCSTV